MPEFATVSALQALQEEKSRIDALLAKLIDERTALMQENARLRGTLEHVETRIQDAADWIPGGLPSALRELLDNIHFARTGEDA